VHTELLLQLSSAGDELCGAQMRRHRVDAGNTVNLRQTSVRGATP
jgi:hypothetical protein